MISLLIISSVAIGVTTCVFLIGWISTVERRLQQARKPGDQSD